MAWVNGKNGNAGLCLSERLVAWRLAMGSKNAKVGFGTHDNQRQKSYYFDCGECSCKLIVQLIPKIGYIVCDGEPGMRFVLSNVTFTIQLIYLPGKPGKAHTLTFSDALSSY